MAYILRYKKILLLLVISIITFFLCVHNLSTNPYHIQTENKPIYTPAIKFILSWNVPLVEIGFSLPGYHNFQTCEVKNCYLMDDRTALPEEDFAAIIFYADASWDGDEEDVPSKRTSSQRYIYFNDKPPMLNGDDGIQFIPNSFFNWTMSYRSDSDIVNRPGRVIRRANNYSIPSKEEIIGRTNSLMFFASSCNSTNRREQLLEELRKYVTLDTYGQCGDHFCDTPQDCFEKMSNYNFYLAFEESYCKDYTSKGLYEALQYDVVPVVFGGADYDSLTPPFSVINAEDFVSVEELSNYIKHLEHNIEPYLNYFHWKKDYTIDTTNTRTLCELCEKLHDIDAPVKSYENILTWWFDSQCELDNNLPIITLTEVIREDEPTYINVPWF